MVLWILSMTSHLFYVFRMCFFLPILGEVKVKECPTMSEPPAEARNKRKYLRTRQAGTSPMSYMIAYE